MTLKFWLELVAAIIVGVFLALALIRLARGA